jgi:hypothetical protein
MKRSEMVKIIQQAIIDYNISIGDFAGYGTGSSDLILQKLEEAGMLPPHHPDRYGSAWCNATNWDDDVYEWENEE